MACTAGRFEGTWKVLVGSREDSTLEVRNENGRYRVFEGREELYSLELDLVSFTLQGQSSCLSLWQNCEYLFGIEVTKDGKDLKVWGAERVSGNEMRSLPRDPERPTWRLGMGWNVQATSGQVPVIQGDMLRIEMDLDQFQLFDETKPKPFDTLTESELNRTLDGAERSIALWRNGPRGQSYLFSMVVVPNTIMEEIEEQGVGDDLEAVKNILSAGMRSLIPFEVDLLARHIVEDSNSVGVWGADEG